MSRLLDHGYIFATLFFTIYSQLIIRWQVTEAGSVPETWQQRFELIVQLLTNPWVASGIIATFFAGISWMLAMTRFELSYAYPWISLNFVLVLVAGVLIFGESLSMAKVAGTVLIIGGVILLARG
jgi:multidrug transporter EmrE-like cation transporter